MIVVATAPLRSFHLAFAVTSGVAVTLGCATPIATSVLPAAPTAALCHPRRGDPVEQPMLAERGGYFAVAAVTTVRPLATGAFVDHVELCVVGGARVGVGSLSVVDYTSYDWHPGDRVLVHFTPGRIGECRVPRGTSLFYVECNGQL